MLTDLSHEERLRLARFVCTFAWADLEVAPEERAFIARLVQELDLDEEGREEIEGYLKSPPPAELIDPTDVPPEHRRVFLEMAGSVVKVDGEIDEREAETYLLFSQLV